MRASLLSIAIVCFFLCLQARPANAQDDAKSLVPNPSFEQEEDGKPLQWGEQTWGGQADFTYAKSGRTGERCVAVSSKQGADAGWFTIVPVQPNSSYRLSGWIKTEGIRSPQQGRRGRGALFNLHNIQSVATRAITGDNDWTRVEVLFETGPNDAVQINCLFGGWGLCTGTAWFDDIQLEIVSLEDWNPAVAIDAGQPGHPISKYIYGQFIEHLGRCIYGGIWAEMLEDRKFHDAAGSRGSPWTVSGTVTMEKEDSFVGEQTPRLAAEAVVSQARLGLVKGKQYVGYVWLKGSGGAEIRLTWGEAADESKTILVDAIPGAYARSEFSFTSGATTDDGRLAISAQGAGPVYVGTVSMMPADNVHGMRSDTLQLLKELNSPVYRWPGGNFVSGYDWRDGIGPRDKRPPRKNPAWRGIEHNDFGLDEFMLFCRLLDTEPYIAVNSGLGGVENAVAELQYANGRADTPMGKLRAENGHEKPYGVKWWGIGNEMYGGWQLGHMPLADYVKKHNVFADALWAEDPSVKLVAVGATGAWSEGMMQHCAEQMDLISEHFYCQERPGLASHVRQIPDAVRHKAEAHREYRQRFESLAGKDIDIALDEWNYWYGPHVYGELGTRYFLKDALGIAAGLNEYTRQSDIMFMANYAQTVNVIGCIKTNKTAAAFATTGLVLKLYRNHYGVTPLAVATQAPLDAAAALSADGKTLTVAIVNPTTRGLELPLALAGAKLRGTGACWQIAGDDAMAYNEPGQPPKVVIAESKVQGVKDTLEVAPCSVTLYALDLD